MKKYIILSEKPWHRELSTNLQNDFPSCEWLLINLKNNFTLEKLEHFKPDKIFIPHWSYLISEDIFENFECVVFHMTDLPFGRGGSPLQNLIVRGYSETKISALRVEQGLDTGPIYLKKELSLLGTAQEIFLRSTGVVREMIGEIVEKNLEPKSQKGNVVEFKRRKPEDGNIKDLNKTEKVFDWIRMLDCEGYPSAYLENDFFRFEFTRASLKSNKEITADVRIIKK